MGAMTLHGGLSLRLLLLALTIVLLEAGLILLLGVTLAKRRRADRALRESESRFRIVADSTPVLIWMSGVDRLFTFFNKPWLDFTGRTAEQEMGNGWAQGVHPGDLEGCLKSYVEAFDEEPLPVAVADRAYGRLLELVASLDLAAGADRRLTDINRVAACSLLH